MSGCAKRHGRSFFCNKFLVTDMPLSDQCQSVTISGKFLEIWNRGVHLQQTDFSSNLFQLGARLRLDRQHGQA